MAERRVDVGGLEVFLREEPATGGAAPVLYLHGVPTNSGDWLPFLERAGGYAPDLPGFGRSSKPSGFDYSIAGYDRFLEALIGELGLDRFSLVVHDWGSVGLALAQRMPERLERLVVMNAVPLLEGYRWHRVARVWRTPLAGELFMGFSSKWGFKQLGRPAFSPRRTPPDELVDRVWTHFDHGTQRAILKLYRSAPARVLEAAGGELGRIDCPSLVLWGADDPYLPKRFAQLYADALGGAAEVELLESASHWPWMDRPEVVERVTGFLAGRPD